MPFKIAYGAGHRLVTAGKEFPAETDPTRTKEWTVNDRVARYFAEAAAQYDVELLRVDDPEGIAPISVEQRNKAANEWGADFCLSIHHNSAGKIFSGGGVVAYVGPGVDTLTKSYQRALYDAVIAATGLKGNRATPLATANLLMCNGTIAPAVLMELGFMDSTVDAPIILTDAFSKAAGYALMEGIASVAGLTKSVDSGEGAEWSREARDWAVTQGLFVGDADGNFRWRDNVTREELAVVLQRLSK